MKRTELKRRTWMRRKPRPTRYNTRTRNTAYMDWVREQSCCRCGAPPPSEAHHAGERAYGRKAPDETCLPLDERCHHGISRLNEFASKAERRTWLDNQIATHRSRYLSEQGKL